MAKERGLPSWNKGAMSSQPPPKRAYRLSPKREETRRRNRRIIEDAAWQVFADKGFEAATLRDIIVASGVSPGTFYNYYGTKEGVFGVVLARLVEDIRAVSHQAREGGETLEERVTRSLRGFLEFVSAKPGGRAFCERNQQHIRNRLHQIAATAGIMADMRRDYELPEASSDQAAFEEALAVRILFAIGLEALFILSSNPAWSADQIGGFIARFAMHGIAALGRVEES